jgi:UDPglucose 6-dehydrogenase
MRIAMVGTGYVGLVAGTCFADSGNDVRCVDIDARKVKLLQQGVLPIYEPGLLELVTRNVEDKRLSFTTDLAAAVKTSDVVFIAVGTPPGESGEADLQHLLAAARQIAKAMERYTVVVDKSTVPVGTADLVAEEIRKLTTVPFDVVSNPEFLKEGAAIDDFLRPDRIVIGAQSERARDVMAELYAPFVRTEHPIFFMDTRSAELTKYAANSMLALRISFMNEIAALCEKVGADVDLVRKGMGSDKRIGFPFLFPGVGYGGSCFPKDVKALIATARDNGLEFDMLRAVERVNERQKKLLVNKAVRHFGSLEGKRFGVWGLAFKPKTDDMREAPAIEVVEGLVGKGATVRAHDPVASEVAKELFGQRVTITDNP